RAGAGHLHVEEEYVGPKPNGEGHRLRAGGRVADDRQLRIGRQHLADAVAEQRVIVGEADADLASRLAGHRPHRFAGHSPDPASGTWTCTRVPCPGALISSSCPRSSRTRSRIEANPPVFFCSCTLNPLPSSVTTASAEVSSIVRDTVRWLGAACRIALRTASRVMRYSSSAMFG